MGNPVKFCIRKLHAFIAPHFEKKVIHVTEAISFSNSISEAKSVWKQDFHYDTLKWGYARNRKLSFQGAYFSLQTLSRPQVQRSLWGANRHGHRKYAIV